MTKLTQPLGTKAYNSIPHLSKSRLGSGDRHVSGKQERFLCEATRPGDRVIVTEKVDGCCATVARKDGELIALSRNGYPAESGGVHLEMFAHWVRENEWRFDTLLQEGERICGEWLAVAHGTLYDSSHDGFEPFLAFDMYAADTEILRGDKRITHDEFMRRTSEVGIATTKVLYDGPDACTVEKAMEALGEFGHHGALETAEGAVWRLERDGRVYLVAKCVRESHTGAKHFKRNEYQLNWGADLWSIEDGGLDDRGYPVNKLVRKEAPATAVAIDDMTAEPASDVTQSC